MNGFVVSFVLTAAVSWSSLAAGQQNAAILTDSRYLSNNGQFGAAYTQADGVEIKEEADAEGNRRGSYSYVDPDGQRRTVTYTAGKDGFKATGDHLPVAPTPVPVPAAVPAAAARVAPAPKSARQGDTWSRRPAVPDQQQWNQQWNAAPNGEDGQWNQWSPDDLASQYDDGQWARWSSESSDDPGKWDGQWRNSVPATAAPKRAQWNQWNSIPATAKWNQWNSAPTAPPQSYSVNQGSGKFNLNRSPDGYSYTFSQN